MPATFSACPAEHLYVDHGSWLQEWFHSRLGCSDQAADLAQDTFVRILSRREDLRRDTLRKPRAFLRVIAHGLLIDHYRRRDVERAFLRALAALPEGVTVSPEDREILLETLQQIDAALGNLPPPARRAFLLSQVDGLTYPEIAARMNVSVRTIKRYMQQGFGQCLAVLL